MKVLKSKNKYLFSLVYSCFLFFAGGSFGFSQQKIDLDEALRLCNSDSNQFLKLASYNIERAQADVLSAKTSGNILYNNQFIHLGNPIYYYPASGFTSLINTQTLHQITKSVPLPGHRAAKISVAKEGVEESKLEYEKCELEFKKQVTDLWLQAWLENKKAEIYARHNRELDSMVKVVKSKGNFEKKDFERAQILQEEFLVKLNKTKVLFQNSVRKIKLFLNTQKEPDFSSLSWIEKYQFPGLTYDSVNAEIIKNRIEFPLAKEREKKAEKELKVAKNAVWHDPDLGILINPQNKIPYLGTYVTIAIPSFDLKKGEIARAKIKIKETAMQNELTKKVLETDARNILDLYTINLVDLQLNYSYLGVAENHVKITRVEFAEKKTDVLSYLEAEREYFQTRIDYFEVLYDFFQSKSDLVFATGLSKKLLR